MPPDALHPGRPITNPTATRSQVAVGGWRSPLVETEIGREISLGFARRAAPASATLGAVGADAATSIVPDGHTAFIFGKYIFEPAGAQRACCEQASG